MPSVGDPIQLTREQREALGQEVLELVLALEAENQDLITDKPIHRDWYNAVPDVAIRNSPWYGASNLVVPLIRTMSDSLIAKSVLTVFSTNQLWTGSSESEWYRDRLNNWLRFLNYGARHGFDVFEPLHDLITETYIHGSGLLQQVWEDNQRQVVAPNAKSPVTVSLARGPKLLFWPSEYALYDRQLPVSENEVIVLQNNMSWGRLTRVARKCEWDEESVASIQDQQGLEGSAAQVRAQQREQLGLEGTRYIKLEPHDIREVWLDWPLFQGLSRKFSDIKTVTIGDHSPKAVTVPIVVTLHRKTGTVLHARYNPYLLPEWPFYETRYRNTDSRGLAKILEHLQRGLSTLVNQAVDSVTMANSLKFVTRDQNLLTRPFTPNQPLYTDDIEGIRELAGQKQVFPEMSLSGLLQAVAERVSGQGDPQFGRETRMGGHPSPATNYLGQQAASQSLNTLPMKSFRRALGKVGEHRSILYQQFEKNSGGWLAAVFDQDDADQIWEVLTDDQLVTGNIRFDVHALSEIHNPDAERQKTVLINQMYTNYVSQVAKVLEVVENPQSQQMPMMRAHLMQAVSGWGKTLTRFLESSDVDDIEEYIFNLREAQSGNLGQLQQLAAGIGGLGAQGTPGGPGGAIRGQGLAAIPGGVGQGQEEAVGPRANDLLY